MTASLCYLIPRIRCSLLALVVLSPASALAQAAKQAPPPVHDLARLTQLDIGCLEFIVAAPLTSEERQQLAEAMRLTWQTDSERMAAAGGRMTAELAQDTKLSPENAEAMREAWRGAQVFPGPNPMEPWSTTEKRVINAHDPIVAVDPAQKWSITERSLAVLRDAAAWTAEVVGLPGPDDTVHPPSQAKDPGGPLGLSRRVVAWPRQDRG